MPTPVTEGRARQISCSDSQNDTLCYQITTADTIPWFMEIATSHILMRTLINLLCWPKKIISEHIRKKSLDQVSTLGARASVASVHV